MHRLLFVLCFLICTFTHAQDPGEPIHFKFEVEAPRPLAGILRDTLEIVRWQSYERLSPELLESLVRDAREQAREAAATEGYFSAQVESRIEGTGSERVVHLTVEPGEPTRVRAVNISFRDGPEPRAAARVRAEWTLQPGDIFRQRAWEAAKTHAVETLAQDKYAAANLASSLATVDPDSASASLEVVLGSGPPFAFGAINIKGLSKYRGDVVINLAPFKPGEPYSREKLDIYARRLNATSYFSSARIGIEEDPALAQGAPVNVAVIEAPSRRLEAGIGYSTDARFRGSVSWRDANLRDQAIRLRSEARLEGLQQSITGALEFPTRRDGWGDVLDASVARSDVQNLVTRGVTLGATRRSIEERRQPAYGVSLYYEQQGPQGGESDTARALFPRFEYIWRTTDDLLLPRKGVMAALRLGVGVPGASTQTFGRALGQVAWFHPLTRRDDLTLRAELGAVAARTSKGMPQALLFRTGGDTSVRGHAFQSLGVPKGDAIVGGRYYALGSAEYTRWFGDAWGLAAFVDVGDAVDVLSDLKKPAIGFGVGVRVKSPIGPFRLDIAHGVDAGKFRLHFSVGGAF